MSTLLNWQLRTLFERWTIRSLSLDQAQERPSSWPSEHVSSYRQGCVRRRGGFWPLALNGMRQETFVNVSHGVAVENLRPVAGCGRLNTQSDFGRLWIV
jgi:hypothetical protein